MKTSDTGDLEECLKIGLNARVMLRRNLNMEKRLVNGSLGRIVRIIQKDDVEQIDRILVDYEIVKSSISLRKKGRCYNFLEV
uniref:Uncharacterized protein n=1 Tax=Romanomermis culicivorax TaxID=13658 RepID=A0A915HRA5_ROMCU